MLALLLLLLQSLLWSSGHLCNPRMKSESESEVDQSYLTLYNPTDCSLPGISFVHGIFQARILERVAISSPGDLPNPGIELWSPELPADSLPSEPTGNP